MFSDIVEYEDTGYRFGGILYIEQGSSSMREGEEEDRGKRVY